MIGRSLRQYRITERLGQGGMGEVWKARDTILDRDVAIKTLPAGDSDAAVRKERFFREAKAASALNHPNIITIYEINSDHGIDFIAMEYVRGCTLSDVLRAGRLSIDAVIRDALQIADAVGRAHAADIVHRDLKPGNIMVNDDGFVKVLDFGLAKMGRALSESTSARDEVETLMATRVGTTVGTVGYMSPEQAVGDVADARSDVFSFGVILYQMLTGALPFAADSRLEALHKLHFSEPPPVASLRGDTPAALAAIVARALAKRPVDRYSNLAEVAADLRHATRGGVAATAPARSAAFPSRAVYVGLAAVVFAVAVGVYALWPHSPAKPETATTPSTSVTDSAGAYELTREAAALLSRSDKEGSVDRAIPLLERALVQDKTSALAHAALSEAYLRKHQTNPDPQWTKLARETAQHAIELNTDLAVAHQAMGFVHLEAGARTEAASAFRRAAELDPLNPMPHVGLGMIFMAQNQDAEAEAEYRKGIQMAPQQWRPHSELGQFYYRRGRYDDAASEWDAAREVTPDNVLVLRNLGAAYYMGGRHDEAASMLQRALEVRPSAATYTNLGTIRFFQGRYADAVAVFEKAVELGANNQLYWGNLGDGLRWAPGRRGEAPAAYRRASDLIEQQIAKNPEDPDLRTRHALYLVKMGDSAAALKEVERVADRPTLSPQMLYRLTVVYELSGNRRQALRALERALKAGYPVKEVESEPELVTLRADAQYHRIINALPRPKV
jgi:eukaryotic-like serine/threonine-protein kinase